MIERFYDKQVSRITLSTGAWGSTGTRTTAGKFYAGVNVNPGETYAGEKRTVFYDAKLFCDAGVSLDHDDIIMVGGVDYHVLSIKNTFDMDHHQRVLLRRP